MLFSLLWAIAIVVTLIGGWMSVMGEQEPQVFEYRVFVEERKTGPIIRGPVVDTEPLQLQHGLVARMRQGEKVR